MFHGPESNKHSNMSLKIYMNKSKIAFTSKQVGGGKVPRKKAINPMLMSL
jgi:hypothetical protein